MPRRLSPLRAAVFFTVICASNLPASAADKPRPDDPSPWSDALAFDYNGAADKFARLHAAHPDDDRVTLAHASALLIRQPRTRANIEEAHALLSRIATAPADSQPSPEAVAADYLLARIAHDHAEPPRLDEARNRYTRLTENHPDHPLAGHAVVKHALLTAHDSSFSTAERVAAVEHLLARSRQPSAAREVRFIVARLHMDAGDDARALPHLLAARAIGFEQPNRNAHVDLTIGQIARLLGDRETALAHLRAYADASPRDPRTSTVRRLIATLEGESTPTAASSRTP